MDDMELAPLPVSKAINSFELLYETADVIDEEPTRLNMSDWVSNYKDQSLFKREWSYNKPSCGTVACAAGWIGILKGFRYANGITALKIILGAQYSSDWFANPVWVRELYDYIFCGDTCQTIPSEEISRKVAKQLREFADTYKKELIVIPQIPGSIAPTSDLLSFDLV